MTNPNATNSNIGYPKMANYDAVLIVSFGGPEGPDDVVPFLENVTRGRGIPRERLVEVGAHYLPFRRSQPDQRTVPGADRCAACRARWLRGRPSDLLGQSQLATDAHRHGPPDARRRHPARPCVCHFGVELVLGVSPVPRRHRARPRRGRRRRAANRQDPPVLRPPRLRRPAGRQRAHCTPRDRWPPRRRARGVQRAQHPDVDGRHIGLRGAATRGMSPRRRSRRGRAPRVGLAEPQRTTRGAVARARCVRPHRRSSPQRASTAVVVVPIGFISDHMEVVYDLDTQAAERAAAHGLLFVRAATAGTDPRFVAMIRELSSERVDTGIDPAHTRLARRSPRSLCARVLPRSGATR